MKGKLVQLSRYGVMLKCLSRYVNRVGIVLDGAPAGIPQHYEVLWFITICERSNAQSN